MILGDSMKRLALISVLGCMFLLTGCNAKKLVCTSTGKDLGKEIHTKVIIHFDEKEASTVEETIAMKFEDEYKSSIDSIYKALKEQNNAYMENSGIAIKMSKGDNNIDVKVKIDVKEQNEAQNAANIVETNGTRADIKKNMEKEGYTCKS